MRRLRKSTIVPNMSVELKHIFREVSQKTIWISSYNKQELIDLLAVQLWVTIRCAGDANTMVTSIVLDLACTRGNVELTATNADCLVMLIVYSEDKP